MIIVFITGSYAVLAPSSWLAITTCFIGVAFIFLATAYAFIVDALTFIKYWK
jgi:hypothetical protein